MARKNIYIAYTGGTIGMKKTSRGYEPVAGFLSDYLDDLPELKHPEMPNYHLEEYEPLLDSANMTPGDWQRIAQDIAENDAAYDGFIILHGTDTMSYSAAALSFMLEHLSKPVIFTGSQIPLSELRSDGLPHLVTSLLLSTYSQLKEVALYFDGKLFRGNRSTKVSAFSFDAFASPNYPLLAEAGVDIKLYEERFWQPQLQAKVNLNVDPLSDCKIGSLRLFPGISARFVENVLLEPLQGLVLESYGTGNAPHDTALHKILAEASSRGVVIVNCTQCLTGRVVMSNYATGSALADAGVISGADMTPEAALSKLIYLFSQGLTSNEIRELMQQNLRGELTP